MDSAATATGTVESTGPITFQSTATIGGDVSTAGSFTVIDGVPLENLRVIGHLGGAVTTGADVIAPELGPAPQAGAE